MCGRRRMHMVFSDAKSSAVRRKMDMYCSHCGKEAEAGAEYCVNCGERLTDSHKRTHAPERLIDEAGDMVGKEIDSSRAHAPSITRSV